MENILDFVDGSPVDFEILYISKLPKFNILTNRFNNYNNLIDLTITIIILIIAIMVKI